MPGETCASCRYFKRDTPESEMGACRFNEPTVIYHPTEPVRYGFPPIHMNEWCGVYKGN